MNYAGNIQVWTPKKSDKDRQRNSRAEMCANIGMARRAIVEMADVEKIVRAERRAKRLQCGANFARANPLHKQHRTDKRRGASKTLQAVDAFNRGVDNPNNINNEDLSSIRSTQPHPSTIARPDLSKRQEYKFPRLGSEVISAVLKKKFDQGAVLTAKEIEILAKAGVVIEVKVNKVKRGKTIAEVKQIENFNIQPLTDYVMLKAAEKITQYDIIKDVHDACRGYLERQHMDSLSAPHYHQKKSLLTGR